MKRIMKKDEATGAVRETKGQIQKEAGKAMADPELQAHGEAEETKGKTTRVVGKVEGKADDVKNDLKAKVRRATE
jgi:uncharacterized protein YjbJ (UPF0337 family)